MLFYPPPSFSLASGPRALFVLLKNKIQSKAKPNSLCQGEFHIYARKKIGQTVTNPMCPSPALTVINSWPILLHLSPYPYYFEANPRYSFIGKHFSISKISTLKNRTAKPLIPEKLIMIPKILQIQSVVKFPLVV